MKKEVIFGVVGSVIILGLVFYYSRQYQKSAAVQLNTSPTSALTNYTQTEIAKHDKSSDCWIIIDNEAYDVTNYLNKHPGGSEQIIPFCGKEATEAFNTKNGRGSHNANAMEILKNLKIGTVKS